MISLSLVCSFSRMRYLLGLGAVKQEEVSEKILSAVAETLKKSPFLQVSEDGKRVGRNAEMSKLEKVIEQADTRTIAASPLEYNVRREDVEVFFGQYGKVGVRLPRHVTDKRCFCGTALVEFSTEDDAKNILKQSLVYAGVELELSPKKDFDSEREKMMVEIENYRASLPGNSRKDSQVNESYPKGLIVAFKLKHTSKGESIEQNGVHHQKENIGVSETEAGPNSTGNDTEEREQKSPGNVKCSEESLDGIEKKNGDKNAKSPTEANEEKMVENAIQGTFQSSVEKVIDDATQKNEDAIQGSAEKAVDAIQWSAGKVTDDATQMNEDAIQGSVDMVTDDATQKNEDAIHENAEKATDAIQVGAEKVTNDATQMNEDAIQGSVEKVSDVATQKNEDATQKNEDAIQGNASDAIQGSAEKVTNDAIQMNEDAIQGSVEKVSDGATQKNEDAIKASAEKATDPVQGSAEKVSDDATQMNEDVIQGSVEKVSDEAAQNNEDAIKGSGEKASGDATQKNREAKATEEVSWVDLKHVFQRFGTVKFVDFKTGEDSGFIRFEQPDDAEKALAAAVLPKDGGLIVKNCIAYLEVVTGDAERDYWSELRGNLERHHWENRGGYRGRFSRMLSSTRLTQFS